MAKNKLNRFSQINTFSNVIQPGIKFPASDFHLKGKWKQAFFKNENPIVLEIGCGKGEYTLGLARHNPSCNYIGIDIKGDRIWKGAIAALEEGVYNAAFLRIQAERIEHFFAPHEIEEIWITFPDPQLRESRKKKRLTSPQFLERYRAIIKPGSVIHLKTDNELLYTYTLRIIEEHRHDLLCISADLYNDTNMASMPALTSIQTYYEKKYLQQGMPIYYLKFSLNNL